MAKAATWTKTDTEARKRGDQTGLDTLVVHALNDGCSMSAPLGTRFRGSSGVGVLANAISIPPGKYDRKIETQRNWRGSAQAVEHVV